MTVFEFIKQLNDEWSCIPNDEKNGKPSNSVIRRMISKGALEINYEKVTPEDILNYPVMSLIFFPNNEDRRVTLFKEGIVVTLDEGKLK